MFFVKPVFEHLFMLSFDGIKRYSDCTPIVKLEAAEKPCLE